MDLTSNKITVFNVFFVVFFFLYLKESRQGGYFDTTILLIGKILNKSCWNEVNTINQKQRENTEVYNTVSCYKDCDKIIVIYNLGFTGLLILKFFQHFLLFWSSPFHGISLWDGGINVEWMSSFLLQRKTYLYQL